ncbi:MAG: hypothetical protein WKF66_16985 [Pedobacter sp.]
MGLAGSCTGQEKTAPSTVVVVKPLQLSHEDSLRVVQNSLLSALTHVEFPSGILNTPLRIMPSKYVRIDSTLHIGGYKYKLEPVKPGIETILRKSDNSNPKPYVEIWEFKISGDRIQVNVTFRSIGHVYECFLNKRLLVDSISSGEI